MAGELRNVLVAYDGFERGEPLPALAIALAREHAAHLHLVHVAPEAPLFGWSLAGTSAGDLHAELVRTRTAELEALAHAAATSHALDVEAHVRTGVVHVEIVREALRTRADLVVVCDAPRDSEHGFRTLTMKLFRFCPCPVLAKRNPRRQQHQSVVAAVDLDPGGDPSLNRAILRSAAWLARRGGGQVVLFHAWQLWGESLLAGRTRPSPDQVQDLVFEAEQLRRQELARLTGRARLEGVQARAVLEKGEVRELLPAFVAREGADVVVMGTVARTGLGGLLMGNTAEKLLDRLEASVLAVKPDGFRSPIERGDD